jgi:hypothetical protein
MAPPTLEEVMINDFYWFSRSRAMVDTAVTSREEAAGKVLTAVGWFWTVYSTVAVVGTAVTKVAFPWWVAVVLALPTVFLLVAYLLALRVIFPYDGAFDHRSPQSIAGAYQAVLGLKRKRLRTAVVGTGVAAGTVALAVLVAAITSPTSGQYLSARYRADEAGGGGRMLVSGRVAADRDVVVSLTPRADGGAGQPVVVLERASSSGAVRSSVAAPAGRAYEVKMEWSEDGQTRSFSEVVRA